MTFQALLISKDDESAAILTGVLSGLGVEAVRCGYSDGICQLTEQHFELEWQTGKHSRGDQATHAIGCVRNDAQLGQCLNGDK